MQFVGIRHGDKEKNPDKTKGRLTTLGRMQTFARRNYLHTGNYKFDLILVSPLERAVECAGILHEVSPMAPMVTLDVLWSVGGEMESEMRKMFDKLGSLIPRDYIRGDAQAAILLKAYAILTRRAIEREVEKYKAKRVLTVGHAPRLCLTFQELTDCTISRTVLETHKQEDCGMLEVVDRGSVIIHPPVRVEK